MAHLDLSRDVFGCEYPHDMRDIVGKGCVYLKDLGPWVSASDGYGEQHSVDVDVIRVFTCSRDLVPDIDPWNAFSYEPVPVIGDLRVLTHHLRRKLDCLHYLGIAGAAADVVSYRVADLMFGRGQSPVKNALGTDDHTRCAESALHGAGLAERRCIDVLLPVGKALDREDFGISDLGCQDGAGSYGLPVYQNRTGSA